MAKSDPPKAPKAQRTAISITVNAPLLKRFDVFASQTGRNRSEMIDKVIEFFLLHQESPEHRTDESQRTRKP